VVKKFLHELTHDWQDRASPTRLLLLTGAGQVFIYTALILEKILRLKPDMFVSALPSAVALLGGILSLLGLIYGWRSFVDNRRRKLETDKVVENEAKKT